MDRILHGCIALATPISASLVLQHTMSRASSCPSLLPSSRVMRVNHVAAAVKEDDDDEDDDEDDDDHDDDVGREGCGHGAGAGAGAGGCGGDGGGKYRWAKDCGRGPCKQTG